MTPAPWFNDGYRIYAPTDTENKHSGRVIVEYKHVDDFDYEDGALIAAAPLLYAALQRAHNCATMRADGACNGCFVSEGLAEARRRP